MPLYRIADASPMCGHTHIDYGRGESVCISSWCPSNNRALEYTNRHSIRAVDRGSYRNLLYSGEVARGSEGAKRGKREDAAIR